MLALDYWRRTQVCPLCGWPRAVCQDPETEHRLRVPPPTRCHVTTAIRRAQKATDRDTPDALLWGAIIEQPGGGGRG